ncbi:hypothetical protein DFH09DRAFT_1272834 [Mycena vulgaris]|nr:hypothetical protein DFH09DRAFT_1272834 [Mycena vulgaris]
MLPGVLCACLFVGCGADRCAAAILIACLSVTALFTALASTPLVARLTEALPACIQMITPNFTVLVIGARSKALASASSAPFQVEIAPANARGALAAIEAFCINAGYAASPWAGYAFSASAQGSHMAQALRCAGLRGARPRPLLISAARVAALADSEPVHHRGPMNARGPARRGGCHRRGREPHLNGIRAILHFLPERLAQAGFPVQRTLFSAGCCSLLYGLGTLPVIAFLDRIGRRRSLLLGSAGLTLTPALVAAPQLTVDVNHHFRSTHLLARGVATGMDAYLFCFSATWGTVPRLLSAELFPLYMRARDRPRRRGRLARVFVETGGQELEGIAGVFGDALPPPQKIKQEDKVLRVHRRHGKGRSAVGLASQGRRCIVRGAHRGRR